MTPARARGAPRRPAGAPYPRRILLYRVAAGRRRVQQGRVSRVRLARAGPAATKATTTNVNSGSADIDSSGCMCCDPRAQSIGLGAWREL